MMDTVSFHEPRTVAEAVAILADIPDARCLAGGQTLVAGMNMGPLRPPALISLRRIDEIRGIRGEPDGSVVVGAMATHRMVAQADGFQAGLEVVRQAARRIAHPAIRTMGTMGGSICHADPAADYPAVLVATDARIEIASSRGRREVPSSAFFVDFLTTAVDPDEMVTAIRFPAAAMKTVGEYEKFARVDGDFATVSVALLLGMRDGKCATISLALGSCGPTPVRVAAAEARLIGSRLDEADIREASDLLAAASSPMDDVRGTAEYRLMLIPRLVARTVRRARDRLL